MNCPGKHGLKQFKTQKPTYWCDVCEYEDYPVGTIMFGCRICDFDLCRFCYDNSFTNCPGAHGLTNFQTPESGYGCNICGNRFPIHTSMFGCRTCNYDLCVTCFKPEHSTTPIKEQDIKPKRRAKKKAQDVSKQAQTKAAKQRMKKKKMKKSMKTSEEEEDEKVDENEMPMTSFKSEFKQLLHVIESHMQFTKTHEKNVNKIIASSGVHADLLRTAKTTALCTEKEILNQIMNISTMNQFLNDIILVENLFNSQYTADQRNKQHHARQQYARNIPNYESKPKPRSKADSFVDLVFYAKSTLGSFKKWLQRITKECEQQKIRIVSNSGAKEKNLERAFYKSFYVYGAVMGEYGYVQMTDVLRCSLVFDDFKHLYRCFAVIETMLKGNSDGGILRCKDRFDPKDITFGYRDLLINMHCPGSNKKVICEVQLHHQLFSKHKTVSHGVYKKARIFEDKMGNNMAYAYADRNIRSTVGDKRYEYEQKEDDNATASTAHALLKEWGLHKYAEELIDENGYDDVAFWSDLSRDELVNEMGFKKGHAKKFMSLAKTIYSTF
eukprot:625595_1